MATPIVNPFSQFELTDSEQISGQTLTTAQLMVIQNLRAEYAIKKINLTYTPNDHQVFLQQEAEIGGWLACLNYILASHESAQEQILSTISENKEESGGDVSAIFN